MVSQEVLYFANMANIMGWLVFHQIKIMEIMQVINVEMKNSKSHDQKILSSLLSQCAFTTATQATIFVNVLPQRNWIESVLSDHHPRWKIWSKEKVFITRSTGFSSQNSNAFLKMFILFVTRFYLDYQSWNHIKLLMYKKCMLCIVLIMKYKGILD